MIGPDIMLVALRADIAVLLAVHACMPGHGFGTFHTVLVQAMLLTLMPGMRGAVTWVCSIRELRVRTLPSRLRLYTGLSGMAVITVILTGRWPCFVCSLAA